MKWANENPVLTFIIVLVVVSGVVQIVQALAGR